jgi:hypothetical protein
MSNFYSCAGIKCNCARGVGWYVDGLPNQPSSSFETLAKISKSMINSPSGRQASKQRLHQK